jgi:hypothetical protein
MANKFLIEISAVDKATAIVRKINKSLAGITEPITRTQRSVKMLGRELGFDKVGKSLSNVGKAAGDVASKVGSIVAPMAAIAGVGSIAAVGMLAVEWGHLGAEITRTSSLLGLSTSQLQNWRGTARAFGVSAQEATNGMATLGNTIEDALYGRNQTALMMMNRLGLSVHRMKDGTIDTTRSMADLSRVISKIPNAQVRGLVARTFGVESMLPMLIQGPKAIAAYQEKVRQLGGVMDEKATAAANRFGLSLNLLSVSFEGMKNTIAGKLIPVLQPFIDRLTEWIGKNRELIASRLDNFLQALSQWLEKVDFNKVLDSIVQLIDKINAFADAMGGWKNVAIGLAVVMNGSLIASVINLGVQLGSLTLTTIPAAIRALGLLSVAMGSSQLAGASIMGGIKALGLLRVAGLVGASGFAGYEFGKHVVNPLIDWGVEKATGVEGNTLGGAIFDATHKPYNINAPTNIPGAAGHSHVTVELKNAPPGTTAKVSRRGGPMVTARVSHAMPSMSSP